MKKRTLVNYLKLKSTGHLNMKNLSIFAILVTNSQREHLPRMIDSLEN
jgi:hypothetical protein